MGVFDFFFGDSNGGGGGAGGAPSHDQGDQGVQGAGPGTGGASTPSRQEARRALEDQHYDEYGLAKPAVSWTERLCDYVAPPEVMNDPETSWARQLAGGFGAIPMVLAGHVMDALSPVDTRGDWHVPKGPILSELAEGEEKTRYQRERAEKEEEFKQRASEDEQAREEWEREQTSNGPASDSIT